MQRSNNQVPFIKRGFMGVFKNSLEKEVLAGWQYRGA